MPRVTRLKTLRDKYAAALLKRGEREVESRSQRFLQFTFTGSGGFYFIGTSGSLRYGPTKTRSVPCTDRFKELLIKSLEGRT